jgi:hypothetical protein
MRKLMVLATSIALLALSVVPLVGIAGASVRPQRHARATYQCTGIVIDLVVIPICIPLRQP